MRATRRVILLSPPLAILRAFAHLADLMLPEARTFSSRQREGEWRYSSRTREEERAGKVDGRITERGFAPTLLVSGPLVAGRWQIATLAWSVEQPPACAKHPAGAPQP